MASLGEDIKHKIKTLLEQHYVSPIERQLDGEVKQMLEIYREAKSFRGTIPDEKLFHARVAEHKLRLYSLIDELWSLPEEKRFSVLYQELTDSLKPVFDDLKTKHIRAQKKERFYSLPGDPLFGKIIKSGKRIVFKLSRIPHYGVNLIRRKKTRISYWKHTVPLRNLAKRRFQAELILDLQKITDLFFKGLCAQYLRIKNWEQSEKSSESNALHSGIKNFKKDLLINIKAALDEILDVKLAGFLSDYEKAGTLEFPNRLLTDSSIEKYNNDAEKKWAGNNRDWKNTIYSLFEEWRLDLDIFILKHKSLAELKDFQVAQVKNLGEYIGPEVKAIQKFIDSASKSLSKEQASDSVSKELKRINYRANKELDKELVPRLCDKLSSQQITNLVNKLELTICQSVEELSDEHVVVKTDAYDYPLKTQELGKISPYELIAFETLAVFQNKLGEIKKELFTSLETITADTTDIDHVITFSLSSAISILEDEGKSNEEALSIALDGLKRASDRLSEAMKKLEASLHHNNELLQEAVNQFCGSILELTVNENVRELRLRITKAKAAKQAEEVRKQLREKLRSRKRLVFMIVKRSFDEAVRLTSKIREKFILTASKPAISKQVSDFLIESQLAIDNLPLIYRRLYRIEPLEDLELFEGRQEEFNGLINAYDNWNRGRYAATAIVGEKWGGLTTFLNFATRKADFSYSVVRFAPKENLSTSEKLMELLKTILKNDTLEDLEQVVDHLNSSPKRIIILEDMQNLYLRKVRGFIALRLLFQLIIRTYKNVFWVTTTTIYTWKYLSKSLGIHEYFSYVIELGELTEEQIINIIWKRNRISGFKIRFEADEEQLKSNKFKELEDADRQVLLKKQFFHALNGFAKSNVSMALIFWLLSTKKVDENTITISSFQKPDLNFLSVLSTDKLFVLQALVLHDGLTEWQASQVLNMNQTSGRLLLFSLLEDGIIFKKNEIYMVNPIVYRNTLNLLKSKNLIH